ncbi:MAG TPA: sugar phosphate nucleotidyltransferase [Thermoanaerobaculia bacterium]|nr:sugar phosphate nucleotidyltransferase [Thermoanaerobaculia bacterium]
MKGMILAAGFGTRFRPATWTIPKPMIPLCNRPLIAWAVDALREAAVTEIVVNLHHLPERIETFLPASWPDLTFHFSMEDRILGTGGGIRRVRHLLEGDDEFLLVNADTVQFPPLADLARARREKRALAALLLRQAPASDRYTKVYFDGEAITGFGEGTGDPLMFCGAHCIGREIFEHLPDREVSGITEDVYVPLTTKGGRLAGVVDDGPWFDIGTPLRYMAASGGLLELIGSGALPVPAGSRSGDEGSLIDLTAQVGRVDHSVIGPRCLVEPRARVESAVLWSDSIIARDSVIRSSIIGERVVIPGGSKVENALVCRRDGGISEQEASMLLTGELAAVPIDPGRAMSVVL